MRYEVSAGNDRSYFTANFASLGFAISLRIAFVSILLAHGIGWVDSLTAYWYENIDDSQKWRSILLGRSFFGQLATYGLLLRALGKIERARS